MAADHSGLRVCPITFAVLVSGLIVLGACKDDQTDTSGRDTTGAVVYSDSLECPNHTVGIPGGNETLPISGAISAIAEFHDCQRLIDPENPKQYSTLAAIWVHERLQQLVDSLHYLNMWMDTAHNEAPAEPGQPPVATGTGITFALIYAWEGPYEPLSIKRGWNCLRVFPSTNYPQSPRYAAEMLPVQDASRCEALATPEERGARPLAVYDHTPAGFGAADFPPVGRWEWDDRNRYNYISLKCGAAWCDVTAAASPHGRSRQYKLLSSGPPAQRRVWEVKGWYDEQDLAIPDPGDPGRIIPASVQGTVVPDPGIDQMNDVEGFTSVWVPAAEIGLKGRLAVYEAKLNLDPGVYPGSSARRLNRLYLCRDVGDGCKGVPADLTCDASEGGDTWYAKMEPSGPGSASPAGARNPTYYCITRHDHSGLNRHIPGTARWWWVADDEKLWIKCAEGCCTVR